MQKPAKSEFNRDSGHETHCDRNHAITRKSAIVLCILLAAFLFIEFLLPLRTTVQIGGDEGFELAKATLWLKGYKPYTDVWNDQPPLHTFLITQTLRHISPSILGPRLITVGFAVLLLTAVFLMSLRISGLLVAALVTVLLIASPNFIGLSSSCMLEIPALAPAMAALSLLLTCRQTKGHLREILAGILFAVSFQTKLIDVILLPLAGLILWLHHRDTASSMSSIIRLLLLLGASLAVSYVAIDCLIENGAYVRNFQQSWTSHFGGLKSTEYGSPDDYPFDWSVLLKNWDTAIPALLGVLSCCRQIRKEQMTAFPLALFALTLLVFTIHRPWWPYYYIHIAIPLCWCAAVGIEAVYRHISKRGTRSLLVTLCLYTLCALTWMGWRVYLQIKDIRNSAQTYSSLVLTQIERYKPSTQWMYADKAIYSFHSGIPLPPPLAVVMLKRMWSGEMTNARIAEEMRKFKPGVILLANDTRVVPFKELMDSEYRLVYEDTDWRFYALKAVIKGAMK